MSAQEHLLEVYHDRIIVDALGKKSEHVLEIMRAWGIGKVDRKKRVHFCGLIKAAGNRPVVFLPRSFQFEGSTALESARLTMRALSRYGHETATRDFSYDGENGNPGTLSVIRKLAEDFQNNGLFVERQRINSRDSGKPDWRKTVAREPEFFNSTGSVVFPSVATTRGIDSGNNTLAKIQGAVISEIIDNHGWWLGGASSRRSELRWHNHPNEPRKIWPILLKKILPTLYSSRSIFLATYLGYYLEDLRGSSSGNFVFGVEDFHTVWEAMLRRTLEDVEPGLNSKLPKPIYETHDLNEVDAPQRGMQTDIILKNSEGYQILDAKYYEASSGATAPGWPDIAKQMFYEKALKSVVGGKVKIRNAFVFPSGKSASGPLKRARVTLKSKEKLEAFPPVECIYMDVERVMVAYSKRGRLKIPEAPIGSDLQ